MVVVAGGIGLAPLRGVRLPPARAPRRVRRASCCSTAAARRPTCSTGASSSAGGARGIDGRRAPSTRPAPSWPGHVGVVTELIGRREFDPDAAVAMVCGPEIMMTLRRAALLDRGVARPSICTSRSSATCSAAIGFCGHCQLGPTLVCRDGPVYGYDRVAPVLHVREL